MKVIGLTGGIGSGKSAVTEYLTGMGFVIIDADKISHEITEKGSGTLLKLKSAFGDDILFDDGCLNRKKLASIVFSDREKKQLLESIVTRNVIDICDERCAEYAKAGREKAVFLDAPLLFETGMNEKTDLVWVVTAELDLRVQRVMKRDNATYDEVYSRIRNQMSDEERIAKADAIIDNSRSLNYLYGQVKELVNKYV